jgi:AAA ATPase domain
MLYGRSAQCDVLERLLADARRSRSGALVVRGEVGAGKTALLEHAASRANGMLVLRANGVESEAERVALVFAARDGDRPAPISCWGRPSRGPLAGGGS